MRWSGADFPWRSSLIGLPRRQQNYTDFTRARVRLPSARTPTSRFGIRMRRDRCRAETILDRSGYSPYVDRAIRGWPEIVMLRGEVIAEEGSVIGKPGYGQFSAQDRSRSDLKKQLGAA